MNWSAHALESAGKLFIFDDKRAIDPVIQDFRDALLSARDAKGRGVAVHKV